MNPQAMAKQMIDYYRTAFETSYTAATLLQDQLGRWTDMWMEQVTWLPKESKQVATQWMKVSKKGSEAYKNLVDENFKMLASIFS